MKDDKEIWTEAQGTIKSTVALILFEFRNRVMIKESDEGVVLKIEAGVLSITAERTVLVDSLKHIDTDGLVVVAVACQQLRRELYAE